MAYFRKRNCKCQKKQCTCGAKWEYRISYKDPFTNKNKVKSKTGFKTKKEASLAASEMEKQLSDGYEETNMSLKAYLHDWLYEYKKDTIRKNTFEIHKNNIDKHTIPYFKELNLIDLKPMMYQKFLNQLTDKGYSKRTVEIVHGTLYSAMDRAVVLGKVQKNPCHKASIRGEKKQKDLEYLGTEDISHFLTQAYQYDYIYWLFFKLLIETGMRKGEAGALQWTDINLTDQSVNINKTLDYQAKVDDEALVLFGDTKTYHSKRKISISNSLTQALRFHMQWQNQNKLTLNNIYRHDLNLVNSRKDGSFIPKSTLFNAFSRILKRAELSKLPIHALRHTHAVLLLEAGTNMKYIQERLGHGSMQITADVYAHISKKIEKSSMDKFEKYTKDIFK